MKKFLKIVQQILSGNILIVMRRYYPFLLFVFGLALIWIATTYSAMHTLREIKKMETELKVKKVELKEQQNIYTQKSQPAHLLERLKNAKDTIKMAHGNTYKIIVKKNEGGENE
jgi:uncharacterized membrane protein YciS (DUF1049 family)